MHETEVARGDRVLRVVDAGDPEGSPLVYFHGTPGSRLDLRFADRLAADGGVRLVSFDRPGYGGSTEAPFGLVSVAHDTAAVADALGIGRFATLGQSGGGPFSLAAASVLGDRVTRAGVASGPGPFALVPGAVASLDDNDTTALALLPDDPAGAARGFADGFEPIRELVLDSTAEVIATAFQDLLSSRDQLLMRDPGRIADFAESMREAVRQGCMGGGWDNVAWVGPWEFDPSTIDRPVLLWYGDEDRFADVEHGLWLRDAIPGAAFVLRPGEGHLGFLEHTAEMFSALTAQPVA